MDDRLVRWAQLAGANQATRGAQAYADQQQARTELQGEMDREKAAMKHQQDEQRRGWWKALLPGALGLAGTGVGMAIGGPGMGGMMGGMLGGAAGNLVGSGIAAQQGVPGAAANFNAMSPMMMQAMMQMKQPGLFADEGGAGFTKPQGAGVYHGATTGQDYSNYVNPPMSVYGEHQASIFDPYRVG